MSLASFNDKVERERSDLANQKAAGNFNLINHLANHPVGAMVQAGNCLPDSHPLSIVRASRAA